MTKPSYLRLREEFVLAERRQQKEREVNGKVRDWGLSRGNTYSIQRLDASSREQLSDMNDICLSWHANGVFWLCVLHLMMSFFKRSRTNKYRIRSREAKIYLSNKIQTSNKLVPCCRVY